jgi:hypothetical protein
MLGLPDRASAPGVIRTGPRRIDPISVIGARRL